MPDSSPNPANIKNRSDSGHFQSDSNTPPLHHSNTPPLHHSNTPPLHHSNTPPLHHSTTPLSLWSLQPNEPAVDYNLFAAWLQLPSPRHFPKAASALGCSVHRLRRLSARHNWITRAAAFDQYRANSSSHALDQLLYDQTQDWKTRLERFRNQEWLLHEEIMQAASEAAQKLRKHPGRASLKDIALLYDLASRLGRLACGLPLDPANHPKTDPPLPRPDVEAALLKIYGPDDPTDSVPP